MKTFSEAVAHDLGLERNQRMKTTPPLIIAALLCLLISPPPCVAQWVTQEIPLKAGWNAVYLAVEPATTDCASIFAGLPVQSVSMWSKRETRLQFTTDSSKLLPRNPDWLTWLPPSNPQAQLGNLFAIHGGQSYLIRLAADASPTTWRVKGTPVPFRRQWLPRSLNLTGLPVPGGDTTFESFFRACSSIKTAQTDGGEIYQINSEGQPTRVWGPSRTMIQSGVAYWIRCQDPTRFSGPLRVNPDYGTMLEFQAGVWTRRLVMKNESHASSAVQVRLRPSETPPNGSAPLAGGVALSYCEQDWSQGTPRDVYKPLEPGVSRVLAPGETWSLELTLRRGEMSGAAAGSLWQSVLEVTDGVAVRQRIGVRAQ